MKPFLIVITLLEGCSELVCSKVNLQKSYSFCKKALSPSSSCRQQSLLPFPGSHIMGTHAVGYIPS